MYIIFTLNFPSTKNPSTDRSSCSMLRLQIINLPQFVVKTKHTFVCFVLTDGPSVSSVWSILRRISHSEVDERTGDEC
jgi:hypothetical protein